MSLASDIGGLMVLGIRGSTLDDPETREDVEMLRGIKAGGVILFDHDIAGNHDRNIKDPDQLGAFIEGLRNELGEDLIVTIDQEGGRVARLDETRGFLESVAAETLAQWPEIDQRQYHTSQARQLARLGIDLNFAPCVDLSIERDSPIIAGKQRAYSDEPGAVQKCAAMMIESFEQHGVRCCIKHFPGHGSSLLDSHLGLCDITATQSETELEVYAHLIERFGSKIAVMCGHLMHREIDDRLPASLSPGHIRGELRGTLGFQGVVICDSLDMRAVRDAFGQEESAVLALIAGNDLLLDGINAPGYREPGAAVRMLDAITRAIGSGRLPNAEQQIDQHKRRVDQFFDRA